MHNVASRFLKAADKFKSKAFVRISADSPIINSKIIDSVIKNFKKRKIDISTNVFPRSFPRGQSVEVIKTFILKKNLKNFSKVDKEHVTKFFYKNSKKFNIKNFVFNKKNKEIKMSIDTKKDLKVILKKFDKKNFENYSIKL